MACQNTKECVCAARVKNICLEDKMGDNTRIRKREIISEVFSDYCTSTSLHGMGYLGAKDKNLTEKIWWIIVFILSLIACSYLITKTWIKWKTDPVILSFEKEQIPIWEIPFPAVTICPINKIMQAEYNYTEKFRRRDNLSEEEYKEFWDISLVCNLEQYVGIEFNCTHDKTDEEIISNIISNAPPRGATILDAKWQNQKVDDDIFSLQITEDGLCFTFNYLSPKYIFNDGIYIADLREHYEENLYPNSDWTLEKGYSNKIKRKDYPRRTTKGGVLSGLSLMLATMKDHIDYVCGLPITGYKVFLHNPAEVPNAERPYVLVPADRKVNILIKPEITKTSESLKSLAAETRKCFFSEEKSLRFFRIYTQSNCRLECIANITFQYCDCIPFYLPRKLNTTICAFANKECVKEVGDIIMELEMAKDSNGTDEDKDKIELTRQIYDNCNCLPSCNRLEYDTETSLSEFHFFKAVTASGAYEDKIPKKMLDQLNSGYLIASQVDIFFKESQFYALKRSEMYGRVDFLANVGGLLGLFMGFSLLSLLEIVYFLTIRFWFKCTDRSKL